MPGMDGLEAVAAIMGTVRNYLSTAMQKTGTTTRHDAARVARDRGWL